MQHLLFDALPSLGFKMIRDNANVCMLILQIFEINGFQRSLCFNFSCFPILQQLLENRVQFSGLLILNLCNKIEFLHELLENHNLMILYGLQKLAD